MEKHASKITIMIGKIINQYGYESPYTVSFCQMCEDYEEHGLFSIQQIENYFNILKES